MLNLMAGCKCKKIFLANHLKFSVNKQFFLSGGLTLDNIENAVNTGITNFFDVSSWVESNPGVKDTKKLKKFINLIKHQIWLSYKKVYL